MFINYIWMNHMSNLQKRRLFLKYLTSAVTIPLLYKSAIACESLGLDYISADTLPKTLGLPRDTYLLSQYNGMIIEDASLEHSWHIYISDGGQTAINSDYAPQYQSPFARPREKLINIRTAEYIENTESFNVTASIKNIAKNMRCVGVDMHIGHTLSFIDTKGRHSIMECYMAGGRVDFPTGLHGRFTTNLRVPLHTDTYKILIVARIQDANGYVYHIIQESKDHHIRLCDSPIYIEEATAASDSQIVSK